MYQIHSLAILIPNEINEETDTLRGDLLVSLVVDVTVLCVAVFFLFLFYFIFLTCDPVLEKEVAPPIRMNLSEHTIRQTPNSVKN